MESSHLGTDHFGTAAQYAQSYPGPAREYGCPPRFIVADIGTYGILEHGAVPFGHQRIERAKHLIAAHDAHAAELGIAGIQHEPLFEQRVLPFSSRHAQPCGIDIETEQFFGMMPASSRDEDVPENEGGRCRKRDMRILEVSRPAMEDERVGHIFKVRTILEAEALEL
jgi:hypothetical protein